MALTSTLQSLPEWPALMSIEVACEYLDLSPSSFRYLTKSAGVWPVDCHGLALARWRRKDLDGMIDSLPARGGSSAPQTPPAPTESIAEDLGLAALERVRRAVRR